MVRKGGVALLRLALRPRLKLTVSVSITMMWNAGESVTTSTPAMFVILETLGNTIALKSQVTNRESYKKTESDRASSNVFNLSNGDVITGSNRPAQSDGTNHNPSLLHSHNVKKINGPLGIPVPINVLKGSISSYSKVFNILITTLQLLTMYRL